MKQLLRRISTMGGLSSHNHKRDKDKSAETIAVFGASLDVLLAKDEAWYATPKARFDHEDEAANAASPDRVPLALIRFLAFLGSADALDTEGLFRIAAPVKAVKELRDSIEKTGAMDFSQLDAYEGIHIVAALLKQWIRDIPNGIVPKKYFQPLLDAGNNTIKLHQVLQLLPKPNRDTLHRICVYLRCVAAHSERNRMKMQNLVIVFAPSLFRCPHAPAAAGGGSSLGGAGGGNPEKYLVESMQVGKILSAIMDGFEEVFKTCSESDADGAAQKKQDSALSPTDTTLHRAHAPPPATGQRARVDAAVAKTVAAMLFSRVATETEHRSETTSAATLALVAELKVVSHPVSPCLNDWNLAEVTRARPRPPGKRAPAPPVDTSQRNGSLFNAGSRSGTVFDDGLVIQPHSVDGSISSMSQQGGVTSMPKKKSVTFSNTNLAVIAGASPQSGTETASALVGRGATPPPPNRPAPAAPTSTTRTSLSSKSGSKVEDVTSSLDSVPRIRQPTADSFESGGLNDGDDELSSSHETTTHLDTALATGSVSFTKKPIGGIPPSSGSQLHSPVGLQGVKAAHHVSAPVTGSAGESLQASRAFKSSPTLDRLASAGIQRISSFRVRSGGSPRASRNGAVGGLTPLGREGCGGDSARTLGASWRSEGSLGPATGSGGVSVLDLPVDVLNSPYLSHRKKRLASKENARNSGDSVSKKPSSPSRRDSASSSHEGASQSLGLRHDASDSSSHAQDEHTEPFDSSQDTIHHSSSPISISPKSSLDRLARKRQRERRPAAISDMSVEQMMEEKTAVKRELAHLKSVFKEAEAPVAGEDRNVMRELYGRYCDLKVAIEGRMEGGREVREEEEMRNEMRGVGSDLDRYALLRHEKKMLQLQLHSFQDEFVKRTGRPVKTAEDRAPVHAEYKRYKELRQTIEEMENRLKVNVNSVDEDE
ncbi:hypothetical protein BC830DRAFT_33747 [Chytriomyces sp. MP71]|nr:hypothetical protein BC830DRAFT_33747 [Chytriomyces sp. MP71]